jgi:hypothetical protein
VPASWQPVVLPSASNVHRESGTMPLADAAV